MLILTRSANEKIVINGNITVSVLQIQGNQVRVGIEAPKDIPIFREEIYEASQAKDMEKK